MPHLPSSPRRPDAARPRVARWAVFLALAAVGLVAAGCGSSGESGDVAYSLGEPLEDSTIAATASTGSYGDTLSAQQFQQMTSPRMPGQMAQQLPDSIMQQRQRAMLGQFVDLAALLGEARQRGFSADSSAVTAQMNQMVAQQAQQRMQQMMMQAGGDSAFQARLSEQDMTMQQFQQQMRQQIRQQVLRQMPRQQIRKRILVTRLIDSLRQEVQRSTAGPSSQEVEERSVQQARQVRLQQILFRLPPGASQTQRDSVRQRARAVLDSAQSGADFSSLLARYDQSGASGSMGYQTRRQMARPFMQRNQQPSDVELVETAFALADSGDVASELVRTRVGYHVLRKTGERAGQPDTATARQQLTAQSQQEALEQAVEELRQNVTLRVNQNLVTVDMSQPGPNEEGA